MEKGGAKANPPVSLYSNAWNRIPFMTNTRLTARLSIMSRQQGLTLLEMLVAVAILAIILTTVAPGIQNIVIKNRITSDLNNLSAVVQRARFSAVDEQTNVVLCPTQNYTACTSSWRSASSARTEGAVMPASPVKRASAAPSEARRRAPRGAPRLTRYWCYASSEKRRD